MTNSNIKKRIPRILPSKIIRGGQKIEIDDIIRDELDSEKIFFNKKINYPNFSKMIGLSIAYELINDMYGIKSSESKKFRELCNTGRENIIIYYSKQTDSRYMDREQFSKLNEELKNYKIN